MELIEKLLSMVEEELEDAEKYAKCSVKYKDIDGVLAKNFYDLSLEEMRHMDILHEAVVRQIALYKQEHGEAPVAMQAVYDFLHSRHIEKAMEVKACQKMYRGS